ncbi:MAG: hypothetical protein J5651_09360 [Salinivirgaceae bacterium]|nr:hypothetical protein [Salinivirgaceae bacterium]
MRKITTIVAALLLSVATFAQVPQGFSYQAVVRDAQNALVANQTVDVTLTLKAEIKGLPVQTYTEKHSAKTNANGLLTLVVGQGESSQKFSDFKWNLPQAIYNLETVTPYGTGTTQLLSVPYALYAEQAGEIDYVKLLSSLKASDLSTILGLAEYLKQADIQELLSTYALKTEIPTDVNLSAYAKTDTIDYYYAKKTDIGAMVDYINDTINYYYAKKTDIPTTVSTFTNDAGYLTAHQSLADYATTAKLNDTINAYTKTADLAAVATSGSYNDLTDRPTIPTVPTNVKAFTNDAGYLVASDVTGKADKSEMSITNGTGTATIQLKSGTSATVLTAHQSIANNSTIQELQQQIAALQAAMPKMATVNVTVNYDAGDSDMAYIWMFGEKITGTKTFKAPLGYALLWKFVFGTKDCSWKPYSYCSVKVNNSNYSNPAREYDDNIYYYIPTYDSYIKSNTEHQPYSIAIDEETVNIVITVHAVNQSN